MTTSSSSDAPYNNSHLQPPLHGCCHCTQTTYTISASPIRVNCCHCLDCRSKSGAAFMINIVIERENVHVTSSTQPLTTEQSPGIDISRCGKCYVALWSTIPALGPNVLLLRAGTLERGKEVQPDVHFFTRSKLDWLTLPDAVRQYEGGRPDGEPGLWTTAGRSRIEKVLGRQIS